MAVEKLGDGTFRVGGMTFSTADQAFDYDAASSAAKSPTWERPQTGASSRTGSKVMVIGPQRTSRVLSSFATLIAGVVVGALYFGPHWTAYRMKVAMDAKDAAAFSSYVDFPALKESVKAQLMVKMGELMKSNEMKDNPFAGVGQMIGMGMINQMVDTLVSPAGVMLMMRDGNANPKAAVVPASGNVKATANFAVRYLDYSTAELRSKDGTPGSFVLYRDGLFGWKLSAVEIPM